MSGGHWNRAGRRSGGYRRVPLIVGTGTAPKCGVEGCAAEATIRVPVSQEMVEQSEGQVRATPLDGELWLLLCKQHTTLLCGADESE